MKHFAKAFRHPVRLLLRLGWLAFECFFALVAWLPVVFVARKDATLARAAWSQRHGRRLARVFQLRLRVAGVPPAHGFLVANHLSYLDIVVLAACQPCVFVAKREVRGWPVLGWLARLAGTIFINRESRIDVWRTAEEMCRVTNAGALVVIFPEGTSSGGETVLPFKSSLLAPLVNENLVSVAHLNYALHQGSVADEICYWGDMTLLPHLLNALTKDEIVATVKFSSVATAGLDRKALAVQLHAAVKALAATETEFAKLLPTAAWLNLKLLATPCS